MVENTREQIPAQWEWKILCVTIMVILAIIGLICYSYYLTNRTGKGSVEGFQTTYDELAAELNANRNNLLNIVKNQNQVALDVDPDVTKYINASNIFPEELKQRLNTNFDIRFSQRLQDEDIKNLNNELNNLKQKMAKIQPVPSKYILKSLGGSAFNMLGSPNDFSLQNAPHAAKCLGFSLSGMRETDALDKGVYKSAISLQCDEGGRDKTQRFKLTEINNNTEYNRLVGDIYSVPDYYTLNTYPFMVAQPVNGTLRADGMINECITFDNSGLSVEPCTGNDTQRWHTYSVNN